ncbi:hypothetical protein HF521_008172 [Silurus meridionalis]|uniref:CSD domain-containing protein n=1 Tax=Silurus meridionalis TaxID=175797 RepID=A0A8T0ANC0_SILME|nr:hypothetical protein HF521_008172 [Silurus meridionalis]
MAEGRPGGDTAKCPGQEERSPGQVLAGSGYCKWFNVRMGFGFISMTHSEGRSVEPPLDVFVHQSKLVMEGFRSLREGEHVEFTFKRSSKGLESLRVTGPGGGPCSGSERRPKGKAPPPKRKPKGDRGAASPSSSQDPRLPRDDTHSSSPEDTPPTSQRRRTPRD